MTPKLRGWMAAVALSAAACAPPQSQAPPRNTLVVGIDVSGSFRRAHYDDAITFAAYYLYGHLNGLGDLEVPTAVFVGSIGGEAPGEVKSFHPISDFQGKSVEQIKSDLQTWFPPEDRLTDFNAFFSRITTLVKRRNLILAPLNVVILSDGVPDATASVRDTASAYAAIDVSGLEYLSRSVTVRLLYPTPTVAVAWERHLPRHRVRVWTVDGQVMAGWHGEVPSDSLAVPAADSALWGWIKDNVDFRVRGRIL